MPHACIRRAALADMSLLVRHRRRMWEEILDVPKERLDAADRAYRAWAGRQMRARRMVGWNRGDRGARAGRERVHVAVAPAASTDVV